MILTPTHEMDITEDEAWQMRSAICYHEEFYRTIYLDDRPHDHAFRTDASQINGLVVRFIFRDTPIVTAKVLDLVLPEHQEDFEPDETVESRRPRLNLYLKGYTIHKRNNTSHCSDRITTLEPGFNDVERAFAEEWLHENRAVAGLNNGYGLIQDLFLGKRPREPIQPRMLSDREHMIVATAIQWLGTNCGRSFLNRVNIRTKGQLAKLIS